ncbi:MAG: hypothetical protein CMJ75_09870 [Planctomycetaceae bacterium]|nr:hypothetical protein [Planctomycetaceae bacterium]
MVAASARSTRWLDRPPRFSRPCTAAISRLVEGAGIVSRDEFLANIRHAAKIGCAYRVHATDVAETVGYIGADQDLCVAMAEEVNAVGGVATVVSDAAAALARLDEILSEHQPKSAICWRHDLLEYLGLSRFLEKREIAYSHYESWSAGSVKACRDTWLAAEIGITSTDLAIAETGSLLVASGPGHERVVSLLPPVHVAIVARCQIVPDLIDAVSWLREQGAGNLASNVTLISGPSKTGDIELQLTTGVHGPGHWYVIVIREAVE